MRIADGKIVVSDDDEELSYEIDHITADFDEDIPNVIGVVRCIGITIESDAPTNIISEAETKIYNEIAHISYEDIDGDGKYWEEAKRDINKETGVDMSRIEIE